MDSDRERETRGSGWEVKVPVVFLFRSFVFKRTLSCMRENQTANDYVDRGLETGTISQIESHERYLLCIPCKLECIHVP